MYASGNKVTTDYNGWSNRETWSANMWLNNDPASYPLLIQARRRGDDLCDQAEWLEAQMRELLDDTLLDEANLWCDLLSTAFNRIDWVEIMELY